MACKFKKPRRRKMMAGGIASSLMGTVNPIANEAKQRKEEQYISNEGNITNRNALQNSYTVTSQFNPLQTIKDQDLTAGEKAFQLLAPGLGHKILGNRRMDRLENRKKQEYLDKYRSMYATPENQSINTNIGLMPMGGLVPYGEETVELEKGEPFMTPDGQINMISNKAPSHKQGGVPITLPSGTKVLGKKPATSKKTFKELGAKLERQQDKYQKILDSKPSRIEEETAKRMLQKVNKQFDELFDLQEEYTDGQQFPLGGLIPYQEGGVIGSGKQRLTNTFGMSPDEVGSAQSGDIVSQQVLRDPNTGQVVGYEQYIKGTAGPQYVPVEQDLKSGVSNSKLTEEKPGSLAQLSEGGEVGVDYIKPISGEIPVDYTKLEDKAFVKNNLDQPALGGDLTKSYKSNNINYSNIFNTVASLAPVAYNIAQGLQKPEQVNQNDFRNPYEQDIRSSLRDREYNIYPEIEAARLASATYARNLREAAPTQAQYLGGLQAANIGEQRAIAKALANKQNIENQYLSEQAQMDYRLGSSESDRKKYIEDINSRARAARRQFVGTGLSQLGQYAQIRQQMNNQMTRDMQRLNLLPSLVKHFKFNSDGTWTFKKTGEVMEPDEVERFIKGTNLKN